MSFARYPVSIYKVSIYRGYSNTMELSSLPPRAQCGPPGCLQTAAERVPESNHINGRRVLIDLLDDLFRRLYIYTYVFYGLIPCLILIFYSAIPPLQHDHRRTRTAPGLKPLDPPSPLPSRTYVRCPCCGVADKRPPRLSTSPAHLHRSTKATA
jgi:hypothetical protein